MAAPIQLTRMHRILIGVVVAGALVIAGIGFAGSYAAVRELALKKGFGNFAYVFPIGIDAGICVLLALDLLLTGITTAAGGPLSDEQLQPLLRLLQHRYAPPAGPAIAPDDTEGVPEEEPSWEEFFYSAWLAYAGEHDQYPDAAARNGRAAAASTLRRYLLPFRIYSVRAEHRARSEQPSLKAVAEACAAGGITPPVQRARHGGDQRRAHRRFRAPLARRHPPPRRRRCAITLNGCACRHSALLPAPPSGYRAPWITSCVVGTAASGSSGTGPVLAAV